MVFVVIICLLLLLGALYWAFASSTYDEGEAEAEDLSSNAKLKTADDSLIDDLEGGGPPNRSETMKNMSSWYNDDNVKVGAIIGTQGQGKNYIVNKWVKGRKKENITPKRLFLWSFETYPSFEFFLDEILSYCEDIKRDLGRFKSTRQKVDHLKELIVEKEFLFVFEDLHNVQYKTGKTTHYGSLKHPEFRELLKFLAEVDTGGLTLLTSTLPINDLEDYVSTSFRSQDLEGLSVKDGMALFKSLKLTLDGRTIRKIIKDNDGHTLSVKLIASAIKFCKGGQVDKNELPTASRSEEIGGKAYSALVWYEQQLKDEEVIFLMIFSLYKRYVYEADMKNVFRKEMDSDFNLPLILMEWGNFEAMVLDLVKKGLIGDDKNGYSMHPLLKNYFSSIIKRKDKKLTHKHIYKFMRTYSPKFPETIGEMEPIFYQIYHACEASLYDEVLNKVYYTENKRKGEGYLAKTLGAWETDLNLIRYFFPDGSLNSDPKVVDLSAKAYLLREAGWALVNMGSPLEGAALHKRAIGFYRELDDFDRASGAYEDLMKALMRAGHLKEARDVALERLTVTRNASDKLLLVEAKFYVGYTTFMLGDMMESDKWFTEAGELQKSIDSTKDVYYGKCGVYYSDFLIKSAMVEDSIQLTAKNLIIAEDEEAHFYIALCKRSMGRIDRITASHDDAEANLNESIKIARLKHFPMVEVEALIERGRLGLEMSGGINSAESDLNLAVELTKRAGLPLYEPEALVVLAQVYKSRGDLVKAKKAARRAERKADLMGSYWPKSEAKEVLNAIAAQESTRV